ncbi:hypothetical protein BH11VER1_BH11VER1_34590 [soil metagenome]
MRQLSSRSTTFYKCGFPAIWLSIFGLGTIALGIESIQGEPPRKMLITFLGFWIVGIILFSFLSFPLKHVRLTDTHFCVRGLKQEIHIPLENVIAISSSYLQNPETITLSLKNPTIFGSKIVFTPDARFIRFRPHPTYLFLKQLLEENRKTPV